MAHSPYSSAREALNKRVKRMESNGFIFPSDILENKSIEEMNALRGDALEALAINDIEGKKKEDFRYGYAGGISEEEVEELLGLDDVDGFDFDDLDDYEEDSDEDSDEDSYEDSDYGDSDYDESDYEDYDDTDLDDYDIDYDYDYDTDDYDPYEEYEDDKNRYTYGDDLEIEYWKSQFFTSPLQDIADKFIRKAIKYYGLDNVRLGIESVIDEKPEFRNYSPSDDRFISSAMSYLRKVNAIMKDIASNNDYDMEPYYSGGETIINSFISEFEFAIESGESYSEIY